MVLLLLFFIVPIALTFALSFQSDGQSFSFANYLEFFSEKRLLDALIRSVFLALVVVSISTLCAYPVAYFLVFLVSPRFRLFFLLLLIAPFWTSFTIRAFSWQMVLADSGALVWLIEYLVGIRVSLGILYTMAASVLGLSLFGIMLTSLMLFSVMVTIDQRLLDANTVLGGNHWTAFREVILPLSLPGWITGATLTFIIAIGDYAVPALLGGGFKPVLAQVMLSVVKGTYDLPMAATFTAILTVVILVATTPLLLRKFPWQRQS